MEIKMGNDISISQYNSMKNVLNYIAENRAHYDQKLVGRIFLEYQTHLSNVRIVNTVFSGKYVELEKEQYNAYKRILKLLASLEWKGENKPENQDENETAIVEGST